MKPGIYLSRLIDDPASKKWFIIALVIVTGLHLFFLYIWTRGSSVPDVKKKPELVIELGLPPPTGSTGGVAAEQPIAQASAAPKTKPPAETSAKTATAQPSVTPASPDGSSNLGAVTDDRKKSSEASAASMASSPAAALQTPTPALSTHDRQVSAPSPTAVAAAEAVANSAVSPSVAGAKVASDTIRTIEADYKAAYLNNPRPAYPRLAHRMGNEGTVILQADVNEEGIPQQVRLFQSSGNDLLDQSALSTVSQWRFTPGRKDGVITRSTVRIPITFSLKAPAKK